MNMGPIKELDQLVSQLLDRGLSESEASRLDVLLSDSPDARNRYQELLDNHEALCAIYPGDVYEASLGVADPPSTPVDSGKTRTLSLRAIVPLIPWAATAAAVLIAVTILFNRKQDETRIAGDPVASIVPVARLVAAVDADWRDVEKLPGSLLETGSFQLKAGTVELEFNDGARVTLRGPAAFELKNANHLHVLSGNLVAQVPEQALGFLVTTPQSAIIDLGTEFGLVVDDAGQTDVHVIDGLVEVYERRNLDEVTSSEAVQAGIKIHEGEARRLEIDGGLQLVNVPFSSRYEILSKQGPRELAFHLLRGNIRLKDSVSELELKIPTSGQNWIEVIPEKSGVLLAHETAVTIRAPGNYRFFGAKNEVIPAGTRVDSYLLHFRSTEGELIRGVIKFDRPIVGLICEANQLASTDAIVGLEDVSYPVEVDSFRGLEPHFLQQQLDTTERNRRQAAFDREYQTKLAKIFTNEQMEIFKDLAQQNKGEATQPMTPEQFNAWEANLIKTLKLNDEQKTTFMTLQNEMRMNFGQHPVQNPLSVEGGGWSPDEVTLSQDMTTLGLSVNVEPIRGVDQLRVLILSKDQAQSR